jgi:secondary thiamine-phosphate synthase enzyme
MTLLRINTQRKREVVDLTERLRHNDALSRMKSGVCHLFLFHTTAALTIADLDPGTDLDYIDAFEAMIPKLDYRHPHDPKHVPDHILSALLGPSLSVPVRNGEPLLGSWQRIVLVEFDGPRQREVAISVTPEK